MRGDGVMTAYRCPYCQSRFDGEPPPRCPKCGRIMRTPAMKTPNPRFAKRRLIQQIRSEYEQRAAGLTAVPVKMWRGPRLYFGVIVLLALLGAALFKAVERSSMSKAVRRTPQMVAADNVDVLAVALGRFKFHTGGFPTAGQGLKVLVRSPETDPARFGTAPGWNGPYISHLVNDPWGTGYVYEPPSEPNGLPRVFSCGPDKTPGTEDDVVAAASMFDPGTVWTNGWVSEEERIPGVRILNAVPAVDAGGKD